MIIKQKYIFILVEILVLICMYNALVAKLLIDIKLSSILYCIQILLAVFLLPNHVIKTMFSLGNYYLLCLW